MFQSIERKNTAHACEQSTKQYTMTYFLSDAGAARQKVCKTFFLSTLGYSRSSSVVHCIMKSTPTDNVMATKDARGGRRESLCTDTEAIQQHIESYHPALPHYRRAHAPHRRYLPNELTISDMHADYNTRHPAAHISYMTYQRQVKDKNISFAKLGTEECEMCKKLELTHTKDDDDDCIEDCEACVRQRDHDTLKREARETYIAEGAEVSEGKMVRSVDLQKVIMLPIMPGVKSVCFTKRIIAFHETFAPIDAYKRLNKTNSIVWHEGLAGRLGEEIASTFLIAIKQDREFQKLVYFMDNCTAQNKNWTLFTALIDIVNSKDISANTITFKYLEAGHTFMSADSIHAEVEKRIRKKKNVFDFDDFVAVVEAPKIKVTVPPADSFKALKPMQSQAKLSKRPCLLSEMRVVEFRRGSTVMHFKRRHSDIEFSPFDFLMKKFKPGTVAHQPLRANARGIPTAKKDDIISKLLPLMPDNRQGFWTSLKCSEDVPDLISCAD